MAGFGLDVHLDLQVGALPAETRDVQLVSRSVTLLSKTLHATIQKKSSS